jgi:hypothetical protein
MALSDTPAVLVNGARQTGKTTLVREIARGRPGTRYVTLDDAATLAAAVNDPAALLAGSGDLLVIDEVQKAPGLFPAMKIQIDRDRRPGRFLLTGSANVLMLPQVSESLAGRLEILTLWPFSQGEIEGRREGLLDALFAEALPGLPAEPEQPITPLAQRLLRGGFPEALGRRDPRRRDAWFAAYVTTILQRDIRDLTQIEGLTDMPLLLQLLAARAGTLLNKAELARGTRIPYTTLDRYLALLHATFLFQPLPAWSGNLGKRLTRSPKCHLCDSGLTAHLTGLTAERLDRDGTLIGPLLESFVVGELRKQASWAETPVTLYHFRTPSQRETDLVLEDRGGRVVGIEVKASSRLRERDFNGLRSLAREAGERFLRGVLLYTGEEMLPFGPRLHAVPVRALWQMAASPSGP